MCTYDAYILYGTPYKADPHYQLQHVSTMLKLHNSSCLLFVCHGSMRGSCGKTPPCLATRGPVGLLGRPINWPR